jgi:hypothetical protein
MQEKTLVLIYGYARSGKTTLLQELKKRGFTILSTSLELDYITTSSAYLPRYFLPILQEKDDERLRAYIDREGVKLKSSPPFDNPEITCRQLKIWVAENEYVPLFGREYLVEQTIFNQYDPDNSSQLIFFETIGGKEAEIIKKCWSDTAILDINIRRSSELPKVDIRELAPEAIDFHNKWQSVERYVESFLNTVSLITNYKATNYYGFNPTSHKKT